MALCLLCLQTQKNAQQTQLKCTADTEKRTAEENMYKFYGNAHGSGHKQNTMQNSVTRISKNIQKHKFSDAYDVGIFLINLVKMAFWYSVLKFQFILHL